MHFFTQTPPKSLFGLFCPNITDFPPKLYLKSDWIGKLIMLFSLENLVLEGVIELQFFPQTPPRGPFAPFYAWKSVFLQKLGT